jgi:hypothetical protein
MRHAGEVVAEKSNFRNSRGHGQRLTATTSLWIWLNGNGDDKEDGLKNGHNGNGKDHLKSGPQWSEGWGAPHMHRCSGFPELQMVSTPLSRERLHPFLGAAVMLILVSHME